jgi:hypothetical protein
MLNRIYNTLRTGLKSGTPHEAIEMALNKLIVMGILNGITHDTQRNQEELQNDSLDDLSMIALSSQSGEVIPENEPYVPSSMRARLASTTSKRRDEIKKALIKKFRKEKSAAKLYDEYWYSQSGEAVLQNKQHDEAVNIGFNSSVPNTHVDYRSALDPLRSDGWDSKIELTSFLKRPVRIYETTWAVGDFLRDDFYPWEAYLNTPSIRRKLENYLYISGSLKLQVFINGTQFHYGKGILAYTPFGAVQHPTRTPGSAPVLDNVQYSQKPHILLDPTDNVGGEMTLPFVYPNNWLRHTVTQDLQDMGRLDLSSINKLGHALGDVTNIVRIAIFAYMDDDVALSGSTQFSSQSGKSDEYGEGVISKPASAVARIAGRLTDVPIIGTYARATEIGAGAVGKIASLFGYCRPINLDPIRKFRPAYLGNIANTSIEEAADKLTFDPKQEISIDPKIIGINDNTDQLSVPYLAKKWSYLTRTPWSASDSADTHLFSMVVNPGMFGTQNIATIDEVMLTPMAFASLPFRYWRGSIKVRVQVAASKFHKGRLRLTYDPNGPNSSLEWGGGYHEIMDISEKRDMEFTIRWNQDRQFLEVRNPMLTASPTPVYDPADGGTPGPNPIAVDLDNDNGVFEIRVLNELVRPSEDDTDTPDINIFVAAGDDFEVAVPYMRNLENISYISQSGSTFDSQSGLTEATPTDSAPSGSSGIDSVEIAGGDYRPDVTSLTYCGEAFMSFRNMLKRYNYHTTYVMPREDVETSSTWLWNFAHPRFPTYKGPDGSNPFLTEGAVWTKMTLMNYLTPAFAARRGGIRWKYNLNSNMLNQIPRARISATRWFGSVPSDTQSSLLPLSDGTASTATTLARTVYYSNITGDGAVLSNTALCPTLELESPYYRNTRYEPTHDERNALVFSGLEEESVAVQVLLPSGGGASSPLNGAYSVDTYVAAGEDFTLDWFVAVPTMYYNDPTPN